MESPRYSTALLVASFLRIVGGVCVCLGVVAAWLSSSRGGPDGMVAAFACVTGGVLTAVFYFLGAEVLTMMRDMARNSFNAGQGLTAAQVERAIVGALQTRDDARQEFKPEPTIAMEPASGERVVVCNMCGKRIRIGATSRFKPGDRANCPGCHALIVL